MALSLNFTLTSVNLRLATFYPLLGDIYYNFICFFCPFREILGFHVGFTQNVVGLFLSLLVKYDRVFFGL